MREINLSRKIVPMKTSFKRAGFYLVRSEIIGHYIKQLMFDPKDGKYYCLYNTGNLTMGGTVYKEQPLPSNVTILGKINFSSRLPYDLPPMVGVPAELPEGTKSKK